MTSLRERIEGGRREVSVLADPRRHCATLLLLCLSASAASRVSRPPPSPSAPRWMRHDARAVGWVSDAASESDRRGEWRGGGRPDKSARWAWPTTDDRAAFQFSGAHFTRFLRWLSGESKRNSTSRSRVQSPFAFFFRAFPTKSHFLQVFAVNSQLLSTCS